MFSLKSKNKSGFTLIETIVALALGSLIVFVIMSVVVSGIKQSASIKRTVKLHSEAAFLIDNLNYLIKQGKDIEVKGVKDILEITFIDYSKKEIKKEAAEIKIDNISFVDENIEVKELQFTEMASSVRIKITLESKIGGEKISISTTIAYRN